MKAKPICQLFSVAVLLWTAQAKAENKFDFMHHLYDYIENTEVFELNQEEGRAYYIPQHSRQLNGKWKFFYADTPEGIPAEFYQEKFSDGKWAMIDVPANWEMRGWGDPLFRNVTAPFKTDPPRVPHEYNPTGAYRTTFTLPQEWKGEEVFLRFEKVASASFLWVNGQEVGYNEGAQEPAEYDITPYLKKGRNTLAMLVVKYSDGYYLEGQDYWRLAGIFDDVYVYATPRTRLFDWYVTTDLDEQYRDAELNVQTTVRRYDGATETEGLRVKAQLKDGQGKLVAEMESPAGGFSADAQTMELSMAHHIDNPLKWTSETPDTYVLDMQLCDGRGNVLDVARQTVGFKESEMRDHVFYLNGKPLKLSAECSHMQHPENGHTIADSTVEQDMTILKQYGFNAVRTSHYPPVPRYMEYAAKYGLYIIDETGDESHATEYVCDDEHFTAMYRERVRRMVLRDRNQPAVLFWSAGNESGEGQNISQVVAEGKRLDKTRFWMYGGNAYSHPAEDIIGPRYPTPLELEMNIGHHQDRDERPSFMDEYISVAGNAGGFFDEMWNVIYSYPRSIGGAVWDFVSTGITETARSLTDQSPHANPVNIMGRAKLVEEKTTLNPADKHNHVLDLNGHDQWVEVYRSHALDVQGDSLTILFDVFPRALVSSCGSFITKGSYQFGVQQDGKEKLKFYINTNKSVEHPGQGSCRYELSVPLPSDWEQHWHHVVAQYDGGKGVMTLSIDGQQKECAAQGRIINAPYPLNIGRNEQAHDAETDVYICDAKMDNVGVFSQVLDAGACTPSQALLWLDFEQEQQGDKYFSYGIGARTYGTIWPDRTVQPEAVQMKYVTRPIAISMIDAANHTFEVWNRNHFLNANHYQTYWLLYEDGQVIQHGELALDVEPLSRQVVKVPFTKPQLKPGCEYRIQFSTRLREDEVWARAGFEVAHDQAELPWHLTAEEPETAPSQAAHLEQTADSLRVSGQGFSYTFTADGSLVSIQQQGKELLREPLQLNVWRAPIANEMDEWGSSNIDYHRYKDWNGRRIAAEYYGNSLDRTSRIPLSCTAREIDGQVYLDVRCFTQFGEVAYSRLDTYISGLTYTGMEETYNYRITGDGTLHLHHVVSPMGKMPSLLPRIGLTMTLNGQMKQVDWYGRGPEENYPDRKSGYMVGVYRSTVDEMYEPYILPEDCGLRCDNRWMALSDGNGSGLRIRMDQLFNFNALPYSTDNLTRAVYQYQLQPQDGVTLNLDYATTGLGCTSRYVLPGYQVKPQRYERQITFSPL